MKTKCIRCGETFHFIQGDFGPSDVCGLCLDGHICECGRELVLCQNGERHCADTLEKFKVKHGHAYGSAHAKA